MTVIMVSHDVAEITRLAGRVLSLDSGAVVRRGAPAELFAPPSGGSVVVEGVVERVEESGLLLLVSVRIGGALLTVEATREEGEGLRIGEGVGVRSGLVDPRIVRR